jgi:hypothetical protein
MLLQVVLLFVMFVGWSYRTSLTSATCRVLSSLATTLNQNQEPETVLASIYAWCKAVVIAAQRWRTLLLSAAAEVLLIEVTASHLRTHQLLLLVRSSFTFSIPN